MIPDFPSNSRNPRPEPGDVPAVEEAPTKKKFEAIDPGATVIRKKTSLGKRFMSTFFSADPNSVFGYLVRDVLVPAAKNLMIDFVTQGIEKAVKGDSYIPSTSRVSGTRTHFSYNNQFARQAGPSPVESPTRRGRPRSSVYDIGEVFVPDRNFAEMTMEQMYAAVKRYGAVSAGDVFDIIGETPTYIDYKYGWMNLDGLRTRRTNQGYQFIFPPLESLED